MNAQPPHPEPEIPALRPVKVPPRSAAALTPSRSDSLYLKRAQQIAFSGLWLVAIAGCIWYFISDRGARTIDIDQRTPHNVEFRVEINSAGMHQFACLPGIGPKTAQQITEWRASNGPFESVESFANVPGISEKMLEELTPWLDCETSDIPQR